MNEYDLDLYRHALNYRTAHTADADYCWKELESCVKRLIAQRDADKERLDWLSENGEHAFCHKAYGDYRHYAGGEFSGKTVRQVIDEAMGKGSKT